MTPSVQRRRADTALVLRVGGAARSPVTASANPDESRRLDGLSTAVAGAAPFGVGATADLDQVELRGSPLDWLASPVASR